MLSQQQQELLDTIIFTGSRIVLLQTLRAGYLTENEFDCAQERKNFRTSALIDEMRLIMENLIPIIEYFCLIQDGQIQINSKDKQAVNQLLEDLNVLGEWITEELKLKNARAGLLEMEMSWM